VTTLAAGSRPWINRRPARFEIIAYPHSNRHLLVIPGMSSDIPAIGSIPLLRWWQLSVSGLCCRAASGKRSIVPVMSIHIRYRNEGIRL